MATVEYAKEIRDILLSAREAKTMTRQPRESIYKQAKSQITRLNLSTELYESTIQRLCEILEM